MQARARVLWSAVATVATVLPFCPARAVDSQASLSGSSFFEQKIRPVLAEHCYKCHSSKATKLKGGLALDSKERALKGGNTGPAIVPSKPEESLLLKAIRHADPDLEMPPKEPKLPDQVIADFEKWIKAGAPFPEGPQGHEKNPHPFERQPQLQARKPSESLPCMRNAGQAFPSCAGQ